MSLEQTLIDSGVFKGEQGMRGLLESQEFWDKQPYCTRLYYGDGVQDYLHRSVLRTAVERFDRLTTELSAVKAERDALREQVAAGDALRISMADVPENILDWASYASEHFQEKYGMQGDADRYKKALSAYDAAISKGEAI